MEQVRTHARDALKKLRAGHAASAKRLPIEVTAPRLGAAWRASIADPERERGHDHDLRPTTRTCEGRVSNSSGFVELPAPSGCSRTTTFGERAITQLELIAFVVAPSGLIMVLCAAHKDITVSCLKMRASQQATENVND